MYYLIILKTRQMLSTVCFAGPVGTTTTTLKKGNLEIIHFNTTMIGLLWHFVTHTANQTNICHWEVLKEQLKTTTFFLNFQVKHSGKPWGQLYRYLLMLFVKVIKTILVRVAMGGSITPRNLCGLSLSPHFLSLYTVYYQLNAKFPSLQVALT